MAVTDVRSGPVTDGPGYYFQRLQGQLQEVPPGTLGQSAEERGVSSGHWLAGFPDLGSPALPTCGMDFGLFVFLFFFK